MSCRSGLGRGELAVENREVQRERSFFGLVGWAMGHAYFIIVILQKMRSGIKTHSLSRYSLLVADYYDIGVPDTRRLITSNNSRHYVNRRREPREEG
ncbi:hypothetical protein L873DRAFT_1217074 [Choiromyces venosus 120613-1]|uniref:Uncharacterized protein n=1 Tax=Choiromyces venosus 120613-1 TaxID=1336337 RepID=A0A3N4JE77_9PEZI|nr:hypothetical protein L873DRAFT_1217074 [Choiromyces venosus 120613-1]